VVELVHLRHVGEDLADAVVDEGVVFPAVPEAAHHLHVLDGPLVALGVAVALVQAEVQARAALAGGDQVPAARPLVIRSSEANWRARL